MSFILARRWRAFAAALVAVILACGAGDAVASPWRQLSALGAPAALPEAQCRDAIRHDEAAFGIPASLMGAIGLVESGRRMPDGEVAAWPWSINAQGVGHVYESKAEAVAAVRSLQAAGVQSIDVGCMQVNLMYHPDAFATLDEAFDPVRNAAYAAKFLTELRAQTGNWEQATADYHSATPELGLPYARKVVSMMSEAASRDLRLSAEMPARPAQAGSLWPTLATTPAAPAQAAMTFGGVHQAPVFFARAPVQMIRPLAASPGRTLAAYRVAPVMLNYRAPLLRAALR